MKKLLVKASEEKSDFHELIGTEVTFKTDIFNIYSGKTWYNKGDKAIISDITYIEGHYSRACPDIWEKSQIVTLQIERELSIGWTPSTFIEFQNESVYLKK